VERSPKVYFDRIVRGWRANSLSDAAVTLLLGGLAGLAMRLAWMSLEGTHDMETYISWGSTTRTFGLARAYEGIYFPLQYQVFELSDEIAYHGLLPTIAAYKFVALVFDSGVFLLLALLLRLVRADPRWALVYWLQPYFLAISWLGYVDAEFLFFVELTLVIALVRPTPAGFLVAGFSLGAAFLMKPQVELLVGMVVLLALLALIVDRRLRGRGLNLALLTVGPAVIFIAYSVYFGASGRGLSLARTYSPASLADASPSLTANMPNIWYPIANHMREAADDPIWGIVGYPWQHRAGGVATAVLIAAVAALVVCRRSTTLGLDLTVGLALAAGILPMVGTRAHENHFFAAAVLGIVPLALARDRLAWIAYNFLLLAQFANLVGLYRFGLNGASRAWPFARANELYAHHPSVAVTLSLIACASFLLYAAAVVRWWIRATRVTRHGSRAVRRRKNAPGDGGAPDGAPAD
jgi:hypothetical protein